MTDISDAVSRLQNLNDTLAENDRLRAEIARLRLTDDEREAVEWAALALGNWAEERGHACRMSKRLNETAETLRKLLARLA